MRVLVTGSSGFAGKHLARALLDAGSPELHGLSRSAGPSPEWQTFGNRITLHRCDLTQAEVVQEVIASIAPDQVYHLAGFAHAGQSFAEAAAAWTANLQGTLNLLNALAAAAPQSRTLFVGSGLIYGEPEISGTLQSETSILRPASPYAASKAAADLACFQMTRSPGLDIVRARPFNHVGPGQTPDYAIAHFAQQIAEIESGKRPPILETGSLEAQRDLLDVRDMVSAYRILMEKGRNGEAYNIGSGVSVSMQSVVDSLCSLAKVSVEVRRKESLLRPNDAPIVVADASKIRRETGWQPTFTLRQTLADTLAFWREHSR